MAWWSVFQKALISMVKDVVVEFIWKLPNKVSQWWSGKSIAVIGATAAGKDSLFQRLKREDIPDEHFQTRGAEKVGTFNFKQALSDGTTIDIKCKRSINVGGEVDERERFWKQSCKDADVIFYILEVERLLNEEYLIGERVYDDLKWIASNIGEFEASPLVHLLVNKVDLIGEDLSEIENKLSQHIEKLEATVADIFRGYSKRVSGITPTSMVDNYMFGATFTAALEAVHSSLEK